MEYVAYKMEIQRQPGTHFPPSMDPIPPSQIPDPPTSRIQRRKPKNLVAAPLELQWENRPPSKPTFYDLADAARKKDAEEAELSQRNLDAMIQRQNAVVPSSVQSTELRSDATAMVSSRIESLSIEGSTAASSTSANNQAAVAQWIAQRSTAQSSVITAAENPSISKGDMQLRLPKRLRK